MNQPKHFKLTAATKELELPRAHDDGFAKQACCPSCGSPDGLHILRVQVQQKDTIAVIGYPSLAIHVPIPCVNRRGSVVSVFYGCELCNRRTVITQQFHKGHVLVRADSLNKDDTENSDVITACAPELWRN